MKSCERSDTKIINLRAYEAMKRKLRQECLTSAEYEAKLHKWLRENKV